MSRRARDVEPPLTIQQHGIVKQTLHVVDRHAKRLARRWGHRVDEGDLRGAGHIALCYAVLDYREELANSFEGYAALRVQGAMIDLVRAETFHERVDRAARRAAVDYAAHVHDDWNGLVHDDDEIQKRYRSIADGLLTAELLTAVDEAQRATGEDAVTAAEEYGRAVAVLGRALRVLGERETTLLALLFGERLSLPEAAEQMGLHYMTAYRLRERVLGLLRRELEAEGIQRAPTPSDAVQAGGVFEPSRVPIREGRGNPRDG
uniref:Uncharacterized protein n=1 Tax=Phaselicystis flava TaxID=525924 RepID=A0A3S5GYI0_9BACT|nr:hypothetical protein [Phaselicystis flava]